MEVGYKKVIAWIMTSLVIVMLFLAGCTGKKAEKINTLDGFCIALCNGFLDCNFGNSTISYEQFAPEIDKQTTIAYEYAEEYRELMTVLCQEMIDNEDEYNYYPSPDAFVKTIWWIRIDYNDGSSKTIEITEYANQTYPDCWDEFVQRTNELTGCEVNELMIDPYDVPSKEIEDLKAATVFFDNGHICFDYDANQIRYSIYEPEEYEIIEIIPEEITESKEFMRQFCEDMLAHKSEYSGYPSETELEEYWQLRVNYYSENTIKTSDIFVTEGGERKYPDDWDEFVQLVNELASFDITVLMTDPAN